MSILGWVWYVVVQLIMTVCMIIGWLLLIPFCIFWLQSTNADAKSIADGRVIDAWAWRPLNKVYGNPEDGVTGIYALVWNDVGQVRVPYMPNAPTWWRAYCWSAWRNSCGGLKYVFAWRAGPQATLWGHKIGWWEENNEKVPVL